jgi:hypothetical protein
VQLDLGVGIERPIQLGLAPRLERCHCRLQKLGVKAEADLLDVPGAEMQKGKRDRAILSAFSIMDCGARSCAR